MKQILFLAVLLAIPSWAVAQQSTMPAMSMHEHEQPAAHPPNLPSPELLAAVIGRPPLSLADFEKWARQTNPTLAQARALVRRSQAQARQAGLWPNPSIGYQGEQIRGGASGGGEQGGFIQQTIPLGGKPGLRRNIYRQEAAANAITVEEQQNRIENDVQQAFYRALASQQEITVRQKLVALAEETVDTTRQLANTGQADEPDILQAEVKSEQEKLLFASAQRKYLQDFASLAVVAGQPSLQPSPISGSFNNPPDLDVQKEVATIVSNSPSMSFARQRAETAEARLKAARREAFPDLNLRFGEQHNGERIGDNPAAPALGAQSFASAGISIPLWNRNQGNSAAAEAELGSDREDVLRTELALKRQAATLAQAYQTARANAESYSSRMIPEARRAYQMNLAKYEQMAQSYPQVLLSQRTLFQLETGYIQALAEEWSSAIALDHFTLNGGLDQPMGEGSSSTSINPPGIAGTD